MSCRISRLCVLIPAAVLFIFFTVDGYFTSIMESRPDNYPRLTLPISELKPAYDAVVIGSGYGAGVAASRMARAGKSVAVLELGAEWRGTSYLYLYHISSITCLLNFIVPF